MTDEGGQGRGSLSLVATPIGNLGDLSPRAAETLRDADVWIVEDTRVSAKLASVLEVKKPMRVLNDHSTPYQIDRYVQEVRQGAKVALLTDGGAPAISDPGALIADACHKQGLPVAAVPGPSAVITALTASGVVAQRFAFLGFLGRKKGAIVSELAPFADSPMTLVLFESPFRLEGLLEAAFEALGARRYAICRELTKAFEQVYRDRLPNVPDEGAVPRKGEFTIVVEGRRKKDAD
ncbi:MAG TPA: 16S rRNA (cytidine(1402)-2'-O)-methyltransferase [Fimbriimonas sp.]